MNKIPISLVIITLNEEKNLQDCLRSVPWAGEKIIVDSGSTDCTCDIAVQNGARVISHPWKGYGEQKKHGALQAANDWILSLDADERLSPELSAEILQAFPSLNPRCIYLLPRKSFHLGRWILHGGWYPDYQTRLFHRKYSNWNQAQIHEKIVWNSPNVGNNHTQKMKHCLHHFVFESLQHQVATNNRYSGLQAEELWKQGRRFSLFKLLTKPMTKFLENYLWKRGFLDGLPGLLIAWSSGYSVFLKWAKLWEIEKNQRAALGPKKG